MKLEQKLTLALPEQYREYLMNFDEVFFDNEIEFTPIEANPWTTSEGKQSFDEFYGLDDLYKHLDLYQDRMPNDLIPIGECPGGNLICLGVKGSILDKVYFWDHENEYTARVMIEEVAPTKDINLYWDNLYFVADTLIGFLHTLEISQDDYDEELDDVELWLDDDLLSDD